MNRQASHICTVMSKYTNSGNDVRNCEKNDKILLGAYE